MAFNFEEIPGLRKNENIVIYAHRHWVAFVSYLFISIFLLVIPVVIILLAHSFVPNALQGRILNYLVLLGGAYYLVILTFIFSAWISYYYDIYILTSDSIVDITQNGFFNRKIAQLPLASVEDVSSDTKGFLPTLFNYGNVIVETAGARVENFTLKDIPNPQYFSDKVLEIHAQLVERELRAEQIAEREGFLNSLDERNKLDKSSEISQTNLDSKTGEIKNNDLNRGGEVKL